MNGQIDTLRDLGQGQRVRLQFDDERAVELRVHQMEYVPDERLRLELTADDPTDGGRYQAEAHVEAGDWTPLRVQRYGRAHAEWARLGGVVGVTPLEMYRTMMSDDMEAQAATGTEPPSPRE